MRTPTYRAWSNMLQRCSPNYAQAKDYFDRGITVCEEWKKYANFHRDMGRKPPELTLDRIDNEQGYCKANCRWATRTIQSQNSRRTSGQSGRRGVARSSNNRWKASASFKGKTWDIYIGYSLEEAIAARERWENEELPKLLAEELGKCK